MTRPGRLPAFAALASLAFCLTAAAQPLMLPGARLPGAEAPPGALPPGPSSPGAPGQPGQPGVPGAPAAPAPPRPAPVKAVSEEGVIGRDLKLNGAEGAIRIERAGKTGPLRARVTFSGTMISKPSDACAVKVAGGEPVELAALGRPEGLPRYELKASACPISFDVVDGAVWVRGPEAACTIEAADCRVDPKGLWGPEPAALMPQAKAIESDRGQADRAVRENYKALTSRAKPGESRAVVAEQAAFSAERETFCRTYAREGAHGFCHARFAEARAASLAARLGLAPATAATPKPVRRPRPPGDPAAAGVSPQPGPPPSPGSPVYGLNPSGIR